MVGDYGTVLKSWWRFAWIFLNNIVNRFHPIEDSNANHDATEVSRVESSQVKSSRGWIKGIFSCSRSETNNNRRKILHIFPIYCGGTRGTNDRIENQIQIQVQLYL